MKKRAKYLTLSLLCCAAMLSICCQRQTSEQTEYMEIGLGIASDKTRTNTLLGADNILSIGVFGYSTDFNINNPATGPFDLNTVPNLLNNQQVIRPADEFGKANGEWIYFPVAYWPTDLALKNSFFAYSPHSDDFPQGNMAVVVNATGYPSITYTLPGDSIENEDPQDPDNTWYSGGPADMVDLLYAVPVINTNLNSTVAEHIYNGKVVYEMKHALTWLSFIVVPQVFNGEPDESYTVDWISFKADALPTTATLNLATGEWSDLRQGTSRSYSFNLSSEAEDILPGEAVPIIEPDNRLMLLPFDITAEANVTIDITFWHNGLQYYYYVPFPPQRMRAGNVIVYVLNISPDGVYLEFMTENRIEEWDYENSTKVELDIY